MRQEEIELIKYMSVFDQFLEKRKQIEGKNAGLLIHTCKFQINKG